MQGFVKQISHFYPRSPCGERLFFVGDILCTNPISIHALLAESDNWPRVMVSPTLYFYPRSPCGERRPPAGRRLRSILFLSTLSLRRATEKNQVLLQYSRFLSTLSLRRATPHDAKGPGRVFHFYPRSPCGERPEVGIPNTNTSKISIHALLAESDFWWV